MCQGWKWKQQESTQYEFIAICETVASFSLSLAPNTSRNKIKTQAATHTQAGRQAPTGCVCDLKAAVVLAGMRRMTYSPLLWVTHPLNGSCGWEGVLCDHERAQTYRNVTSVVLSWSCRWSFSGLPQQLIANTQIIKVNGRYHSVFHVSVH